LSLIRWGLSLSDIERLDKETDIRDSVAIVSEVERQLRLERLIFKIDIMDAVSIANARVWSKEAEGEFQKQRRNWIKELRDLEGVKDEEESWLLKNRRSIGA
jgi:hypothetical protein